jgi:hypothetical protein
MFIAWYLAIRLFCQSPSLLVSYNENGNWEQKWKLDRFQILQLTFRTAVNRKDLGRLEAKAKFRASAVWRGRPTSPFELTPTNSFF